MASLQRQILPALPPAAAPPVRRARFQRQRTGCQPPHALLPSTAELLLATLSTLPGDTGLETFEPQLPGPAIAVAAAAAATPPILFWARIFQSAERRQRAIEAEQAAEQERQRQREVRGWRAEVWAAGCALGNSRFQACDPVFEWQLTCTFVTTFISAGVKAQDHRPGQHQRRRRQQQQRRQQLSRESQVCKAASARPPECPSTSFSHSVYVLYLL